MKVTNITVGYDRKRKPADYESAGANVQFSASLDIDNPGDDTDHVKAAEELLKQAQRIVLTRIGIIKEDAPVGRTMAEHMAQSNTANSTPAPVTPATPPKPEEPKAPAGKKDAKDKADKADKAKADKPKASSDIPGDEPAKTTAKASSDIPGDEPAPAKKDEPAKAAASSDIPADVRTPASGPAPTGSLDAAAVQLWVTEIIRKGKINSAQVREIMEGEPFKVSRLRDLASPELLAQFRKTIADKAGVTL